MIIVTGATGQLGSQIVERLLERVPADQVGVSVRHPGKATSLARRGAQVRRGDFAEPASLTGAFAGASQVLVVSVDTLGKQAVAQSTTAIDAAYRAGASRVLYTSHQAANPESFFAPARDHAAVETHLEEHGRPYTSLRNGYYSTTSLQLHARDAAQTGELVAPADGPASWTAPADLAEAAAAILAGEGRFDGPHRSPPPTQSTCRTSPRSSPRCPAARSAGSSSTTTSTSNVSSTTAHPNPSHDCSSAHSTPLVAASSRSPIRPSSA